ncbi:hypothetical protein [Microbulbifer pacificus]|uniref:hypothetical protein n=1 Tax=Microbulbifer pacificus TaxID=407164 RepID=UPI00131A2449|nr:hypothetical protein [Microbulbifer pacificus]
MNKLNTNYIPQAVEILKAMYGHNSNTHSSVGRTDIGPEPLTAEQVAKDLRVIYEEMTKRD